MPDTAVLAGKIASVITPGGEITLRAGKIPVPEQVLSASCREKLVTALNDLPNGVLAWSRRFNGLVETSSNLAVIESCGGKICVDTSQRSFIAEEQRKSWHRPL